MGYRYYFKGTDVTPSIPHKLGWGCIPGFVLQLVFLIVVVGDCGGGQRNLQRKEGTGKRDMSEIACHDDAKDRNEFLNEKYYRNIRNNAIKRGKCASFYYVMFQVRWQNDLTYLLNQFQIIKQKHTSS